MATTDVDVNNVLLKELRSMYPEVPERIVTNHMIKHKNDRAKVIEVLDHEGPQNLFEKPLYDPIQRRMENLTISHTEGRTRSDSGSSGVSSTSTNSVSSVSSVPYGGGNARPPPDGTEFSQFMSPSARSTNIPNINCNVFTPSSPPVSTSMALGKVNKPHSRLQPIQVLHVQTSQGQSPTTRSDHNSPPPRVSILVNPRSNNHNAQTNQFQHPFQQQMSYPSTNTTPHKWQSQQSVPGNSYNTYNPQGHNYLNTAGGISPGIHTVERQAYRKPPVSPQPPESAKPSPSQSHISFPSQYGGHSQPQQSQWNAGTSSSSSGSHSGQQLSQATIYLEGANKPGGHGAMYNSGTQYNHQMSTANIHGSHSEPYLLGGYNPSQHHQPQTPQGGSNATKPLFIKVASLTNQQGGAPSQYRYKSDSPSSAGSMNAPQVNSRYGNISGDIPSRAGPQTGAVHPGSYVGQLYLNEVASTIGNGSSSHGGEAGQLFMHYPPVPTTCRVPGHPSSSGSSSPPVLPARTGIPSSVSENVINRKFMEPGESQHISHATFQPLVSPASSQSSLSSESSSQREIQRPRSGSVQEEADYISALLLFQKERMSKLKLDLETELRKLAKIRNEVTQMEKNMLDRTRTRNLNFSPHLEDVARLRGHNMKLQAEIQVMTRELDMYNNGQTPLGVLDPLEQQNFFQNMNPGQRGSIYSRPPPPTPTPPPTSETPPPIPPRIHHVPPPPPPQPLTGSGDLDGDGEQWNCSACTFLNHPALNKCECCEMPRMNAPPPTTDLFDEYHDDSRHNELNDAGNDFELV
ncbi:TGF-beta-activated kinase 1 and MAP3K7-binding protein 3-like isoform X1 [Mizuhopecten yessoensis]|uniref:TGF-beta-activated kinase 1 and MAP3K7-binding protein 3-like isoform X1 n=2 Tax=Mizuhopecten yessoensis TaxID=6573 RepID=UPI000B45A9E5|nr:TGF-beta-activated kinase 1 and MAP3K7-binding protein 3-like isoform X1 [Mizuhopecten yessoensis]XP_021355286.1 TGF-beta-activated kinase 1 and MAP3K7-binding protein 3-like isoform X1 [Mizuhopecten yessoensis]